MYLLSLTLLLKQWALYINKIYHDVIRMTKGERSSTQIFEKTAGKLLKSKKITEG